MDKVQKSCYIYSAIKEEGEKTNRMNFETYAFATLY